jgi:Resolvase, N terminal domain
VFGRAAARDIRALASPPTGDLSLDRSPVDADRCKSIYVVVVDGYVRSAGGDRCDTPAEIQKGQIARAAASRGWRLGRIFDASSLEAALERIESGESDGLVVVRVCHLGASTREVLGAIERVQAAGGRFVSVRDGIDLSTDSGRLVLRVLMSVVRDFPQTPHEPEGTT